MYGRIGLFEATQLYERCSRRIVSATRISMSSQGSYFDETRLKAHNGSFMEWWVMPNTTDHSIIIVNVVEKIPTIRADMQAWLKNA